MKDIIQKIFAKIPFYYEYNILKTLKNTETVLDLGCGPPDRRLPIFKEKTYVGVEIFHPYLKKANSTEYDYILGDVTRLMFRPKTFDIVIVLEVIEHLKKQDGIKLLNEVEKIAKHLVLVTTPNGTYMQESYDNNIYQIHQSAWTALEFQKRGYRVMGMFGWKKLRKRDAHMQLPSVFRAILFRITQLITLFKFEHAFRLFSIKNVE